MKSHKQFHPTLQKLVEKLYHNRVIRNFATKEFAHLLSLTPEALRKIEKGESDLSFTTFLLITKLLEIDCSELMKGLHIEEICLSKKAG
jgi:transcriptional regulator with XRE-family HTH domain